MLVTAIRYFPLWAAGLAMVAWLWPAPFRGLAPAIVPLLGVIMLGMGLGLRVGNFTEALRRPALVSLGVALQFTVMPLAAWVVGRLAGLPPELLAGMVLVGSCPGGTASNVICYLARGDVALSITMTTVSTLAAVVMTPVLTWVWAGTMVPVPVGSMLFSILQIVLLPVLAGVALNHLWGRRLAPVKHLFPLVSVVAIALIVAIIVALQRDQLPRVGGILAGAVALHNVAGLAAGYGAARLAGLEARLARTLAIEVGMQNSGLAVALAAKYFSAAAALPGALFSVWHNLSGAALASWWQGRKA